MDAEVQEMLDHFRIRKVLAQYCRGSDRADETLMRSVYAQDSWDDHGIVQADGAEFSRVMCRMVIDTTDTMSHTLGQSLIEIDGDSAAAETYFIAVALEGTAEGKPFCNQLGGRFVDRLVREDGAWKVKHRVVMRDWSVAIPVTTDWESSKTLRPGERSGADVSYEVFGTRHDA
jgi:hypothetical protein